MADNADLYRAQRGKAGDPLGREASDRRDLYYRKEQEDQRRSMYSIPVHADDGDGRLLAASENDFRRYGKERVRAEKEDREVRDYVEGRKPAFRPIGEEVAKMMGEGLKHVETWAKDEPTTRMSEAVKANVLSATDRGVVDAADAVNLPAHYARYKIEPIRFLVENFGPVILVGKVVKYTMRYDAKNGLEDIAKAKRCLHMLGEYVKGNPDWWKREA